MKSVRLPPATCIDCSSPTERTSRCSRNGTPGAAASTRWSVTRLWREAERLAVKHGLVATGYERSLGAHARVAQFAKVYLFHPSSDVYTCPLAMTDGAARTLLASGNQALIDRAVPHADCRATRRSRGPAGSG